MKSFTAVALGAVLLASQHVAEAFSPASRSKVLQNLQDMRMDLGMTGAGGAATPDSGYVDGEFTSASSSVHT